MPKTINIAVIQLLSQYGQVENNLHAAAELIAQAASAGAQIVVLPEVFNTGYGYTPGNYALTEEPGGRTTIWLIETAQQHNIHLAGSFLLRKNEEIYNTMLLVAPHGQIWQYDKTHPWGWEAAYFTGGTGPVVAETEFGRIGMLICWDVAHPHLYAQYAGKIDLMLISSCPPKMGEAVFHLPSSKKFYPPAFLKPSAARIFNQNLRAQTAWLGVPVAQAMPKGDFSSPLPPVRMHKLFGGLAKSDLKGKFYGDALIADASGQILAQPGEANTFTLAKITLADTLPSPKSAQPKMNLSKFNYWVTAFSAWLSTPTYKKNKGA